jgi:hypothetical protein
LAADHPERTDLPARGDATVLLCGLAGGIVHVWTNPDSTLPTVGASGAIAGVLGAYFFLFPTARVVVMFPILFLPRAAGVRGAVRGETTDMRRQRWPNH